MTITLPFLLKKLRYAGYRLLPKVPVVHDRFPDWTTLLSANAALWQAAKNRAEAGTPVLIATNTGGIAHASTLESVLAAALTLRGANVHLLLCDKVLPGCQKAVFRDIPNPAVLEQYRLPEKICQACLATGEALLQPLGLKLHRLSELLTPDDREQARRLASECPPEKISAFEWNGIAVGEHARAGALRYFTKGNLAEEPFGEVVLRRYLEASLLTTFAVQRLTQQIPFEVACFHHGIYVPQGLVGEVCRSQGIRVVNWNPGYRKNSFIFSHGDTYHHTLLDEPVETWEEMPWDDRREQEILSYLNSRWQGSRDWIQFHKKPDLATDRFAAQVGLDWNKPCIGMLTNVVWDAQLHYRANAFPDMLVWAIETIRYFRDRPELQLLIRVHPAEIGGTEPSRQPIIAEIKRHFPTLPQNVFIIPPESAVSTYATMLRCNAVIIYGTKTGVELTSIGIPVIVGGEAWIRNKGLTLDASSPEGYFALLDRLPLDPVPPAAADLTRARQYAFHFFFRRMIPLPFMEAAGKAPPYLTRARQYLAYRLSGKPRSTPLLPAEQLPPYRVGLKALDELLPGKSPGLDLICDGILTGSPFVYPAERLGVHDAV